MRRSFLLGGLLLLAVAGVLLTGALVLFITPPTFESVARVALKATDTGAGAGGAAVQPTADSLIEQLQSPVLLQTVITNLDLSAKWGARFKLGPFPPDVTEKLFRAQLTVKRARESVIDVRVTSEDPAEAAEIANALVGALAHALTPVRPAGQVVAGPNLSLPPISILVKAVPNLRPVRPHPFVKMLVPLAGLVVGLLGVLILFLGVSRE